MSHRSGYISHTQNDKSSSDSGNRSSASAGSGDAAKTDGSQSRYDMKINDECPTKYEPAYTHRELMEMQNGEGRYRGLWKD